jgi:hypothetical protein
VTGKVSIQLGLVLVWAVFVVVGTLTERHCPVCPSGRIAPASERHRHVHRRSVCS